LGRFDGGRSVRASGQTHDPDRDTKEGTGEAVTTKRPKVLFSERYKVPGMHIRHTHQPVLPHIASGFVVEDAYVLEAGRVEIDGREREFQVIKVMLKPEGE
jgi:hypothetical protein